MDRPQAEKLYESGKEVTVEKLLELDAENKELKEKVAQFEKSSQDSSKPKTCSPLPLWPLKRGIYSTFQHCNLQRTFIWNRFAATLVVVWREA